MDHLPKSVPFQLLKLADPFTGAPDSRHTITRQTEDMADYAFRTELLPIMHQSPYFCRMLGYDSLTHEQCVFMARYI